MVTPSPEVRVKRCVAVPPTDGFPVVSPTSGQAAMIDGSAFTVWAGPLALAGDRGEGARAGIAAEGLVPPSDPPTPPAKATPPPANTTTAEMTTTALALDTARLPLLYAGFDDRGRRLVPVALGADRQELGRPGTPGERF